MPHIVVEYSANLEQQIAPQALVDRIHAAIMDCGVFERSAVRTRAERRDVYRIYDGAPANAFLHVTLRIGPGRSLEIRRQVGQGVVEAILGCGLDAASLALSVEVQEIDDSAMFRRNGLHARGSAAASP